MKGLQQFLGIVNYYHWFIPAAATILQPLYVAKKGRAQLIHWTALMDATFQKAKTTLSEATMLVHPCANTPLALTTDTSNLTIGAVLEQFVDQSWQPLAFYSCQLWPLNANRALLTANCWHCIWQCGISVFHLRVTLSSPT